MMGKDIKKLQDLITSLETVKEEEDKKKEELEKQNTNETDIIDINTNNEILENQTNQNINE